jgi:hypothetical protein
VHRLWPTRHCNPLLVVTVDVRVTDEINRETAEGCGAPLYCSQKRHVRELKPVQDIQQLSILADVVARKVERDDGIVRQVRRRSKE